mmetsp:Transcript_546/g.1610  ORF Transcript_546/g.1610 Transcript_546/m.1610 type:complete len:218 (+) Transcript_546:1413-2066(+)
MQVLLVHLDGLDIPRSCFRAQHAFFDKLCQSLPNVGRPILRLRRLRRALAEVRPLVRRSGGVAEPRCLVHHVDDARLGNFAEARDSRGRLLYCLTRHLVPSRRGRGTLISLLCVFFGQLVCILFGGLLGQGPCAPDLCPRVVRNHFQVLHTLQARDNQLRVGGDLLHSLEAGNHRDINPASGIRAYLLLQPLILPQVLVAEIIHELPLQSYIHHGSN